MNPPRPDPDDDRLLEWLAEYDRALEADGTEEYEPPAALDAAQRARLARLQDCVRRLHDLRRAVGSGDTPDAERPDTDLFAPAGARLEKDLGGEGVSTPDPNSSQERLAALLAAGAPDVPEDLRSAWEQVQRCIRLLDLLGPGEPVDSAAAETPREGGAASGKGLPERVGRFLVSRELGGGGFGVVYLAWDPLAQRAAAVKVPRSDVLLAPELRRRFVTEARAAAALDHPNIVPLYEAGEDGPAGYYLASAYCPGPTLAAWLKAQPDPVPVRDAAALAAALADGLAHAHARGVIHRDLKPANILLSTKDTKQHEEKTPVDSSSCPFVPFVDHFVPRITDFGLARTLAEAAGEGHTETGVILGTPEYMAPEQAAGLGKDAGPAADVYALGTILYELLTGRPPFRGDTRLDTMLMVRADEPVSPRRLRANVPADLETVCLKCLQKAPARRYATAGELADDLRRFLAGEPIHARPVSAWERLLAWVRRRPAAAGLVAVSAASLLGLVLGIVLYLQQLNQSARNLTAALTEKTRQQKLAENIAYAGRFKLAYQYLEKGRLEQAVETLDDLTRLSEDDLRGFEWYHLKALCHPLYAVWRGHTGGVTAVAVSPDGRTVATDGHDHTVRLWDRATGRSLAILKGHQDALWGLSFLEDGRTLLAVGDKEIWQWDIASREKRASWYVSVSNVEATAIAANGRAVAWAHDDAGYSVWSAGTGQRKQIRGDGQYVAVAFAPDAKTVAIGCRSGKIEVRDVATDELRVLIPKAGNGFPGHTLGVWSLAFTPDGGTLASGSHDTTIRLWDAATGAFRSVISGHDSKVQHVAFAPDGRTLVSASWRDERGPAARPQLRLWDTTTGQPLANLDRFAEKEASLPFTSDGRHLVMGCDDHTVRLLDIGPGPKRESRPGHAPKEAWAAAFSPDGQLLATAGDDAYVRLWDVATGRSAGTLRHGAKLVTSLAFFPDGQTLASAGFDGTVRLWDVEQRSLRLTFVPGGAKIRCLAVSPDGRFLAAGTGNGSVVRLLNVETGQVHSQINHGRKLRGLAFTPDGTTLATVGEDGQTRLWDSATGDSRGRFSDTDQVGCVAFSADGQTLATGNKGGIVRLWDAAAGHERATLKGHHGEVFGLAFAPNGKTLATAGADGTVRLWQTFTGEELIVLDGHRKRVNTVAFTADGRTLVSADHAGTVVLWRAPDPTGKGTPSHALEDYQDVPFGQHGSVVTAGAFRRARANAVAVQPDGKLIVVGFAVVKAEWQESFLVLRYNPNGTLDTTFGRDGIVVTDFGGLPDVAFAVALQPDGKILVAGQASERFALARYNSDGSPDTSFGKDGSGKVVGEGLFGGASFAHALALQPNGKFLAAGEGRAPDNGPWSIAVARFHADGSPDATFGPHGKGWVTVTIGSSVLARALALQPDGRLVTAGERHFHHADAPARQFALACFLSDGGLDPAFSQQGKALPNQFPLAYATGVASQEDGKLVVAGLTHHADGFDFALLRLLPDGQPDTHFGSAGTVTAPLSRHREVGAVRVVLRPDGRAVVTGFTGDPAAPFALLQLDRDGRLDPTFGTGGRVGKPSQDGPPPVPGDGGRPVSFITYHWPSGLALQPDGKIVLCGHTMLEGGRMAVLVARYRADGRPDSPLHRVKPAGAHAATP